MRYLGLIWSILILCAGASAAQAFERRACKEGFCAHIKREGNDVILHLISTPKANHTNLRCPNGRQVESDGIRCQGGYASVQACSRSVGVFGSVSSKCGRWVVFTINPEGPPLAPIPINLEQPRSGPQQNQDRPGSDYLKFATAAAGECEAACGRNSMCRAWTWVRPGVQGVNAQCYLKKAVPNAIASSCCTSGVKR